MIPTCKLRACFASLALASALQAQTITVTIPSDVIDVDPSTATVADLPGPDGQVSFSEAMIASNNTPGHQIVGFAIPPSLWQLQFAFPGRAVVMTGIGFYQVGYDPVTIDGTTQTAFSGNTNANGAEVVFFGSSLRLVGDGCIVRGVDSSAISLTGSFALAEDNSLVGIEVYGGHDSALRNNTGTTFKIDRSSHNVLVGNTLQRVRVLGWFGGGQPAVGNRVGGPAPEDRNFITGYGTWNGEGYPGGTTVQIFDSVDTVIENNWIGTTPDGLAQGNLASVVGVGFEGNNDNSRILNNRIAGILGHGQGPHAAGLLFGYAILVAGSGSGLEILGNTLGLDSNGMPTLGSVWGISMGDAVTAPSTVSDIQIGGTAPGQGNEIAGHLINGVTVGRNVSQVRLSGNSIHDNNSLGIDLIPTNFGYGVTANDALDADTGGNGLQNYPTLSAAFAQAGGIRVLGTLSSAPNSSYQVEFFASPACDSNGFGEGRMFLAARPRHALLFRPRGVGRRSLPLRKRQSDERCSRMPQLHRVRLRPARLGQRFGGSGQPRPECARASAEQRRAHVHGRFCRRGIALWRRSALRRDAALPIPRHVERCSGLHDLRPWRCRAGEHRPATRWTHPSRSDLALPNLVPRSKRHLRKRIQPLERRLDRLRPLRPEIDPRSAR